MGIIIRQSAISSAITYIGALIGFFNVIWLYPNFFPTLEEMGLFRIISETAILMVPFAQMGISTTLIKFYPNFSQNKEITKKFLNSFLAMGIVAYLIFICLYMIFESLFMEALVSNYEDIQSYIRIILALVFVLSISGILEAYSKSLLKIIFPNFLKDIVIRIFSGGIVSLYFLGIINLDGLLISLVVVYAVSMAILIGYLFYLGELSLKTDFEVFDKNTFNQMIAYGGFALLGSGSSFIVLKIDTLMIAEILGLSAIAIYTTALFIATVIEMPRRMVTQVITPILADNFRNNKLFEVNSLYKKSSINLGTIGIYLFIGIVANLDSLYFLVPKWQLFEPGKIVVIIIGFTKLIDMIAGVNGEIILMSKHYKFNIIAISCLAILSIFTNLLLIPEFGIKGAAFASFISIFLFNTIKMIFLKLKYNIQPFSVNTLKVIVLGGLIYWVTTQIPRNDQPLLDILIRSSCISLLFIVAVLNLKISTEFNRTYNKLKPKWLK